MARAHATVAGLAERVRLGELAEAASADPAVDAGVIATAIAGGADDVSDFADEAERAAAARALEWIERRVGDANTEVDSYLTRYPELTSTEDLAVYAYDLAIYRIFGGNRDSERYQRYQAALAYLRRVATGDIDLQLDAAEAPGSAGSRVRHTAADAAFGRGNLRYA